MSELINNSKKIEECLRNLKGGNLIDIDVEPHPILSNQESLKIYLGKLIFICLYKRDDSSYRKKDNFSYHFFIRTSKDGHYIKNEKDISFHLCVLSYLRDNFDDIIKIIEDNLSIKIDVDKDTYRIINN